MEPKLVFAKNSTYVGVLSQREFASFGEAIEVENSLNALATNLLNRQPTDRELRYCVGGSHPEPRRSQWPSAVRYLGMSSHSSAPTSADETESALRSYYENQLTRLEESEMHPREILARRGLERIKARQTEEDRSREYAENHAHLRKSEDYRRRREALEVYRVICGFWQVVPVFEMQVCQHLGGLLSAHDFDNFDAVEAGLKQRIDDLHGEAQAEVDVISRPTKTLQAVLASFTEPEPKPAPKTTSLPPLPAPYRGWAE